MAAWPGLGSVGASGGGETPLLAGIIEYDESNSAALEVIRTLKDRRVRVTAEHADTLKNAKLLAYTPAVVYRCLSAGGACRIIPIRTLWLRSGKDDGNILDYTFYTKWTLAWPGPEGVPSRALVHVDDMPTEGVIWVSNTADVTVRAPAEEDEDDGNASFRTPGLRPGHRIWSYGR
jgi:hypothetical protein